MSSSVELTPSHGDVSRKVHTWPVLTVSSITKPNSATSLQPTMETSILASTPSPPTGAEINTVRDPTIPVSQRPSDLVSKPPQGYMNRFLKGIFTRQTISQTFTLLWLAPVIKILILNFKEYIIGASVWCPFNICRTDALSYRSAIGLHWQAQMRSQDRDFLGVLQFIAKAIEAWFMFIATGLIFDIAMLLAKQPQGLPLGYLLTHLQFADVRNIFNKAFWRSMRLPRKSSTVPVNAQLRSRIARIQMVRWRPKTVNLPLGLFVLLTFILTIISNLMGPSTAALLIPTLQWRSFPVEGISRRFAGMNSAQMPKSNEELAEFCKGINPQRSFIVVWGRRHSFRLTA